MIRKMTYMNYAIINNSGSNAKDLRKRAESPAKSSPMARPWDRMN